MSAANQSLLDNHSVLFRASVEEAAAAGAVLMAALINAARASMHAKQKASVDLRERDALIASAKLLSAREQDLCQAYPKALLAAFCNPEIDKGGVPQQLAEINFDDLELMDELQVQSSVVMARAQQSAMLAAEASLAELNTLMCGALGLSAVQPERNPLRPAAYVTALKDVVDQQHVPVPVQLDWMATMSSALGQELRKMYDTLSTRLRGQGVVAAGYVVRQNAGSGARRALFELAQAAPTPASHAFSFPKKADSPPLVQQFSDPNLLTLDKLRRLLSGELESREPLNPLAAFEQEFSRQFESHGDRSAPIATDFQSTVPAALEALQEMKQVDRVVQRLERRQHTEGAAPLDGAERRGALPNSPRTLAQALSLEVVKLMIESIASDPRLLLPIRNVILGLEVAFQRLCLVDARLFTDKNHPARMLLQEITHRSLAYRSTQVPGFAVFLEELQAGLKPLTQGPIESAALFELALIDMKEKWSKASKAAAQARVAAVEVLQHVEQRNVLAEKIAREITSHKDASSVPAAVIDFLCGPWAQVVAQSRLSNTLSGGQSDKYHALISALLWSTHPELTRKNIAKLTRLLPLLLSTLREGLETIRYPSTKTASFFETLMGIHQLAFRGGPKVPQAAEPMELTPPKVSSPSVPILNDDLWVAPDEAKASNFVELPDLVGDSGSAQAPTAESENSSATVDLLSAQSPPTLNPLSSADELPIGSWIELLVEQQWVRTQLTWASPHGTLFLFTSALGHSQSMTRRSRDKLVASGGLRVVSGVPVVDEALNAVAQIALRNSVDSST